MSDHPSPNASRDTLPAFVPSAVLIGVFTLILALLMQRPAASVVVELTPEATPEIAAPASTPSDSAAVAAALPPSDDDAVRTAFAWSCSGCHGLDGAGNPPFGDGFLDSPLLDDPAALTAFLTDAQPPVDPAVRYPHPVRGGYPPLDDAQIAALVAYLTGGA